MDILSFVGAVVPWLQAHAQLLFAVLGVASMIARVTPTEADNQFVDFVLGIVHTLGLTKPQDPPAAPPAA